MSFVAAGVRQGREQASVEMMERDVGVTIASLQYHRIRQEAESVCCAGER